MIKQVIWGVVVPTIVAAVGVWSIWGPRFLRTRTRVRDGALAVGVAAAMLISLCAEIGWPALPPAQKWHALAWIAICLMAVAIVAAWIGRRHFPVCEIGAVVAGVIVTSCITLPGSERAGALVIILGIAFGIPAMIRLSQRIEGAAIPLALWMTVAAISVLAVKTTFPTLAISLGAVSATWCAAAVIGRVTKMTTIGPASALVGVAIIVVSSMVGWTYSYEFHPVVGWHWVVAAMSPLAMVATTNAVVDRWPPAGRLIVRMVVVAVPLAVVLVSVLSAEASDDSLMGY